jgi:rRNA-processing protein FCF1
MTKKVILDASFLIDAPRFHIDIIQELDRCLTGAVEAIVLSETLFELTVMKEGRGGKDSRTASLALAIARAFPLVEVKRKPEETVDDLILRLALERQWIVATNDRALRRRLRDNNVYTIFVRKKSHLEGR